MRRLAASLLAVGTLFIAGPAVAGPAIPIAAAHAQLVSSVPGAGERLDEAPVELALVFSERLDQLGTGVDVLDADGRLLVRSGGTVDPTNRRSLIVPVPSLADGLYTVNWRSLSADDGHVSQGFFNFGVGDVVVPGSDQQSGGDIHAGHDLGRATLETLARAAGELGSMLAFGLVIIALAVVAPVDRRAARMIIGWSAVMLILAGAGAALMVPLVAASASVGAIDYLVGTQSGQLLVTRAVVGFVVGGLALASLRMSAHVLVSALIAAFGGALMIALLALAGHASGFESVVPVLFAAAHVASAGCWMAGLVVLAWFILADGGRRRALLAESIPRFSAVALVSVGLFALTGGYLWWLMNRAVIDLGSDYGTVLVIKATLVIAALALGALSFLAWRPNGVLGTTRRIPVEAALAICVVAVTALLASGSPPGPTKPVPIAEAATSGGNHLDADLFLLPARPGPNQLSVQLAGITVGPADSVILDLQRLDQFADTTVPLVPMTAADGSASYMTDALLPADSQWDASVRLVSSGGEQARARFAFAFDTTSLSEGQARPLIDPLVLIGLMLGAVGVVGLTILLAGGVLPRTDPRVSRWALVAGGSSAIVLAIAGVLLGPQV